MIDIGAAAPDFSLSGQDGRTVRLKDFRGKKVVLYFYPKDDTPGCTKEACAFRDSLPLIDRTDAVVLGVSADSVESHARFAKKHGLNFQLLSDETKEVLKAYGVWRRKSLYGRLFMGTVRTTYIIDERGKVAYVFPNVKVKGHTQQVLEALENIGKRST